MCNNMDSFANYTSAVELEGEYVVPEVDEPEEEETINEEQKPTEGDTETEEE